jgi:putative tricarboxylic transport membrane protein
MNDFLSALSMVSDPLAIAAVIAGSIIGIIFGSVPGLTFTMALSLVLPLTFGMPPNVAICLLLSTYIGGMTGGSISAILIGIPGTPSAAATVFDGLALARRGQAGLALGYAVIASGFGSIFSLVIMVVAVDFISQAAIHFGPVELFALVLFGMSLICGLSEGSILRGVIAGVIGLMIMTVGLDDLDGVARFTFGSTQLLQGVNLVVAMVGLFAVPHLIQSLVDYRLGRTPEANANDVKTQLPRLSVLRKNLGLMIRSSSLGTIIGAIPGTGGPIAAFVAYDQAKRFSKDQSKFGKGEPGGILAPESANNAVTGGAIIPLLSLGIPGDPATAIMLGGLLIHGVIPGPSLFVENKPLVYLIYLAFFFGTVAVVITQTFGIRLFVKVLKLKPHLLMIAIMVMCVVGTFAIRNSFFDVYTMVIVGLIGYLLTVAKIPIAPVVLGIVLGPTLEKQFRTALILTENDYSTFFSSPLAVSLYILAVVFMGFQIHSNAKQKSSLIPPIPSAKT